MTIIDLKGTATAGAWTSGHVAGLRLAGIGSNPQPVGSADADAWEAGYKVGRDERERRDSRRSA